ncbi:MAG: hypothetical protein AAFV96_14860, partial [Pseudomonadota bacterium]
KVGLQRAMRHPGCRACPITAPHTSAKRLCIGGDLIRRSAKHRFNLRFDERHQRSLSASTDQFMIIMIG